MLNIQGYECNMRVYEQETVWADVYDVVLMRVMAPDVFSVTRQIL